MESSLDKLLGRLEAVTDKLEGVASRGPQGAGKGTEDPDTPEWVPAFGSSVMSSLSEYYRLSDLIGGEVAEISQLIRNAMLEVNSFIGLAGKYKKPTDPIVANLLANVKAASEKVVLYAEERRAFKSMNNLFAVKELFPYSFGFLMQLKPKKVPKDALEQGMFYSNRVLKDYKDKDQNQVAWCRSFSIYTTALTAYIEEYLPTGLEWNPLGPAVSPGTVPPRVTSQGATGQSGPSIAESLKGGNVTEGLKKVEKSQMSHKNPELKASSLVQAKDSGLDKPMKGDVNIPRKDPVFILDKKRWRIEHYENKRDLVVSPTELSHTLYVFNCSKCTIVVNAKINSITLDKCFHVAVVFEDVISQFETINCQRIEAQSNGQLPLINIDKSDQISIYLCEKSKNAEIIQAKCSAMNINIPTGNGEFKEIALPEQFRSVMEGSKYVTTPTDSI